MSGLRRILIVDDSPDDRELLRRVLERMSFPVEIVEVATRREALPLVEGQTFDLVFMDQKLPNGKGIDTIRELRLAGSKEPIMLITGAPSEEDRWEALRAGAQAYVGKEEMRDPAYVEHKILDSEARASGQYLRAAERARAILESARRKNG